MPEPKDVRILLMEDDPGLARLFQKRLARHGYQADLARDGEEGLAMYDADSYDILVMDHVMPVYTGVEVIRILAARGPLPPIIMVTGTGSEQIAVEAMKLGASDYLVKDVDGGYFELLPSVIEQALHQHRLVEEKRRAEAEREQLLIAERDQRLLAETLAEVTLALASLTSSEEVLGEILHQARRIVPHSASSIALLEDGMFCIARSQGYEAFHPEQSQSGGMHSLSEMPFNRNVVESRRSLIIRDTAQEPQWVTFEVTNWVKACILIPICLQDRVLGLLRLDSDTPGTFSERDAERLRPFANAAAIALENARLFREVQRLANIDELTGTYNRRFFFELAERELGRACRFGHPLSAVMLDIDHFKRVNDHHGHTVGDQVLREVARRCHENIREVDILGRYGGEEFIIILPETDAVGASATAERLRRIAHTAIITDRGPVTVTLSLGVATLNQNDSLHAMLKRADQALYGAKQAGRNRVCVVESGLWAVNSGQ
ncbi:MAG: diguanylate cyclase [Ardenticatenaceae bacterium]|nr:diguanylate cyclase [Ardenticatenaceae bacterium]